MDSDPQQTNKAKLNEENNLHEFVINKTKHTFNNLFSLHLIIYYVLVSCM